MEEGVGFAEPDFPTSPNGASVVFFPTLLIFGRDLYSLGCIEMGSFVE
jgi:hypothetical protein